MTEKLKKYKIAAALILLLFLAPDIAMAKAEGVLNALFDISFGVMSRTTIKLKTC